MAEPRAVLSIDRSALRANMTHAKRTFAPDGSLMVAVKSNAYGLGASQVIPEILESGADELAVLDIDSGLAIRPIAPDTPLFAWLLAPHDDYRDAIEQRVELGVSTTWQLEAIEQAQASKPAVVHLKIDTGLRRNGASVEQWPELVAQAKKLADAGVIHIRAIWSHLADTSVEESVAALGRLRDAIAVAEAMGVTPSIAHIAASHAAVEIPEARLDMVRLGILGYGISPFDGHSVDEFGFQPTLTLTAPIVAVGEGELEVAIGYRDGLLSPEPGAWMVAHGTRLDVLHVGPETTRLRLPDAGVTLSVADQVVVWGHAPGEPTVEQWAQWCHTIGDEVVVKLHPDIRRVVV